MTSLIIATIALAIAVTSALITWKNHHDLTEYLDTLNIAQEEEAARANRLFLDLQHTKERVNADLVHLNQRLKDHSS